MRKSRLDSTRLRLINLDLSTKSRPVELVDIQVKDLVENLVEKVEFLVEKVEIQIHFLAAQLKNLVIRLVIITPPPVKSLDMFFPNKVKTCAIILS